MSALPRRPLGRSGLDVSVFALGSWRTYERIPRAQGVAVLQAARECGIDFLEVARYDDETGTAPIRTGWSEVVFGELFRRSGWPRDAVVLAGKLWWEFWPQQSAAQELDASLERTGLDHFDLLYCDPTPEGLPLEDVVAAMGALLAAGKARAWGVVNWPAGRFAALARAAATQGVAPPCAAQLRYSVVRRSPVEDADLVAALDASGASAVASNTLAGGILSGKYAAGAGGRMAGELGNPRWAREVACVPALQALAAECDAAPAALAYAFALTNPRVATVLFGATEPWQVRENARAAELLAGLSDAQLARLRAGGPGPAPAG